MALQQTGAAHGANSHCTSWRSPGTADSHTMPTAPPAPTSGCTRHSSSTSSSLSATQPTTALTWTFCFSKTCVCVCVWVHVCACVRACVPAYLRVPVWVSEHACIRVCMWAHICMWVRISACLRECVEYIICRLFYGINSCILSAMF